MRLFAEPQEGHDLTPVSLLDLRRQPCPGERLGPGGKPKRISSRGIGRSIHAESSNSRQSAATRATTQFAGRRAASTPGPKYPEQCPRITPPLANSEEDHLVSDQGCHRLPGVVCRSVRFMRVHAGPLRATAGVAAARAQRPLTLSSRDADADTMGRLPLARDEIEMPTRCVYEKPYICLAGRKCERYQKPGATLWLTSVTAYRNSGSRGGCRPHRSSHRASRQRDPRTRFQAICQVRRWRQHGQAA
jgi:hypothetical protein